MFNELKQRFEEIKGKIKLINIERMMKITKVILFSHKYV
jgi:tetrahydromethanopterin S-methyltransferase subunit G